MRKVVASSEARQCRRLAERLVANQTWPTPIRLGTMEFDDDPAVADDPGMPGVARTGRTRLGADLPVRHQTLGD